MGLADGDPCTSFFALRILSNTAVCAGSCALLSTEEKYIVADLIRLTLLGNELSFPGV